MGRLWRRAPAWRLLLVTAIACTALAAMFPPVIAGRLVRPHQGTFGAVADGGAGDTGASFKPAPAHEAPAYATLARPALGTPRSGVIAFNGRQLPLPPGSWQVVSLGRAPEAAGAVNVQVETFAQLASRAVTGVIVALTPDPVSSGPPPPSFMQICLTIGPMAGQITPPDPANPLANECWVLTTAGVTTAPAGAPGSMALPELDRFRNAGITVPERMLALDYRRSDQNGWLSVTLLVPERAAKSSAELRNLQLWARTYATSLHRGFDSALPAPTRSR